MMMKGLNVSLVGLGRRPICTVCTDEITVDKCHVDKWKRSRHPEISAPVGIGDNIPLYLGGDAVATDYGGDCSDKFCPPDMTAHDARYQLVIQDGNVYAVIVAGRHLQYLNVIARINLADASVITVSRSALILLRPQQYNCPQ